MRKMGRLQEKMPVKIPLEMEDSRQAARDATSQLEHAGRPIAKN
jgi:hypothetical protein